MTLNSSLAKTQGTGIEPFVPLGYAWFAGSGVQLITAATVAALLITNPVDSGVNLNLARIRLSASGPATIRAFTDSLDDLPDPPSAVKLISNCILDGRPYEGVTTVRAAVGSSFLQMGDNMVELSTSFVLGGNSGDIAITGPFLLTEGHNTGFLVETLSLTDVLISVNVLWEEHANA